MYQEFFQLQKLPFGLTPNPAFFCHLKSHQDALNTLQFCIESGEGFIKIIGEVGSGKTLLCRKLLEQLDEKYATVYMPNPEFTPLEFRKAFARELGLDPTKANDQHELLTTIYHQLISLHASGKHVVLLIDEAQALTDECLETIRLVTNLETSSHKLLQVVLFAQPELNERLDKPHLRQLKQRISFSYNLPLMSREDLDVYLNHRLAVAGHTHGNLFTKKARRLLFEASNGVPRVVNILSHKALLSAYGKGNKQIDDVAVKNAVADTESVTRHQRFLNNFLINVAIAAIILFGLAIYMGNFPR